MMKSMTGYASVNRTTETLSIAIEIRGYNSRHLDTALKLPSRYAGLEEKIKKIVAERVVRGRVEIRLTLQEAASPADAFSVNTSLAIAYYQALRRLQDALGLEGEIPLGMIAAKSGVIDTADIQPAMEDIWPSVAPALEDALVAFDLMKTTEGAALSADLMERIGALETSLKVIEIQSLEMCALYQEKLKNRMITLTQGVIDLDPARIAQEAAFYAERSDISEEIVRAAGHLNHFRQLAQGPEPAGRALNFLVQELNREFNTMGNKAGDGDISRLIVAAKTDIEKIREQIQNIE